MDRNQLLFAMGVIKGMLASATDEDVKMSLNVSLEFIAKALQGYEMVKPEPVGMNKPAPEELEEPTIEPDAPEELEEPTIEPDAPEELEEPTIEPDAPEELQHPVDPDKEDK